MMTRYTTEEAQYRAMLSQQEANEFVERELCCPYCGYMVGIAFSDCTGHLKLKCKKCKRISVLNFAYFCRRRFRRNKTFAVTGKGEN